MEGGAGTLVSCFSALAGHVTSDSEPKAKKNEKGVGVGELGKNTICQRGRQATIRKGTKKMCKY